MAEPLALRGITEIPWQSGCRLVVYATVTKKSYRGCTSVASGTDDPHTGQNSIWFGGIRGDYLTVTHCVV